MIDSSPQTMPLTDQAVALARLGGNFALWKAMVGFFLEDAPLLMMHLHEAYRSSDFPMIERRAHSLKGLSATFEAITFQQLALEIESLARSRDLFQLDAMIPQLAIEFDRLATHLRELMLNLPAETDRNEKPDQINQPQKPR